MRGTNGTGVPSYPLGANALFEVLYSSFGEFFIQQHFGGLLDLDFIDFGGNGAQRRAARLVIPGSDRHDAHAAAL
jgi:hypothetical protein